MDINFADLEQLIKLAERSDINSLEVTDGDARISIICKPNSSHIFNDDSKRNIGTNSLISEQLTEISTNSDEKNISDINSSNNIFDEKVSVENAEKQVKVLAPMLGTFFRRSAPTADEFFKVGDQVDRGQTLCIVEAMKMMHEVKADTACIIKEVLIDEGDIVEYGQALFIIEPNS